MIDEILQKLIDEFAKLPGIGPKSATRLAFWVLAAPEAYSFNLANALVDVKKRLGFCEVCANVTAQAICQICSNKMRDNGQICVVEEIKDLLAIERTGIFRGKYHVLGGAINPLNHIGPNELRIESLLSRIFSSNKQGVTAVKTAEETSLATPTKPAPEFCLSENSVAMTTVAITEIILATNPTVEGEATASYLVTLFEKRGFDIKITRLARGIPMGADLEYADELTLSRALESRNLF